MALSKSIELDGGLTVVGAYLIANALTVDRITGAVQGVAEVYRDEAARRQRGAAHDAALAALADFTAAQGAHALAVDNAGTSRAKFETEPAAIAVARTVASATQGLLASAQEKTKAPALKPILAVPFDFQPGSVPGLLNPDKTINGAALYAAIRANIFPGSTDC